jgi:hypothetical protein
MENKIRAMQADGFSVQEIASQLTPIRGFAAIMAGVIPDDQQLQDRRVAALLDDGVSYRRVAALLGMSLGEVQRAARRARELLALRVAVADPIVELLAPGELSMLDRYRFLGLPATSEAGRAARDLFDHGRGGEAFDAWMRVGQVAEP